MATRPRVLIEDWLPMAELGIESRREAAPIPGQFPKLKTLHVWWARRPLAASAGAVLGSLMPSWSPELAAAFPDADELSSESEYRSWFLRLCGVLGDPVTAKAHAQRNAELGVRSSANPYTYKQAFKNSPTSAELLLLHSVLNHAWGNTPSTCDPCAGGGSIPFCSSRYGLKTSANDLNPVAAAILLAGLQLPASYRRELADDLVRFGRELVSPCTDRLEGFFPQVAGEVITNYIFARTISCPRTGKLVPLSPNWWLSKGVKPVAVRLVAERAGRQLDRCEFEIEVGKAIDFDPDRGTVAGGDAISPWDGLAIDGDHIKAEAQAGRMGDQLYAVAIRTGKRRGFRAPTQSDLDSLVAAERELTRLLPQWLAEGIVPDESIDSVSNYNRGHRLYGINTWREMFSPRQLLVHGTFVEEFRRLMPTVKAELEEERADAVLTLLALMQGKAVNASGLMSTWDTSREKTRSVFDSHNFAFKWTYAEFEGARELMPWCLDQIVDAYSEIAQLLQPSDAGSFDGDPVDVPGKVTVTARNAADLSEIENHSVELVCIDPPYYDNVMYAELSDFFYVWEKRTLGLIHPELFATELTDKQNEAVANPARFADMGKRRKQLANADYEAKMAAIFGEAERVLRDDGVMMVMFTHKRAEAWDTLGMGLMQAGFTIETSWPVNTESEQSLHQAKKNAAASTIMLVCRKREQHADDGVHPYFEDLEGDVRAAARDALEDFQVKGIEGVDLLLATYGPALSVISAAWPVYSSEADPDTGRSRLLRPEEALDAARAEVVRLQRQRLVGAPVALDPLSDFTLIAWDTFRAAEFPYDEARRLALAIGGLDVDELAHARLIVKKAGTIQLLTPEKRVRRGDDAALPGVRPSATTFGCAIDAVHTVMYVADQDGLPASKALIDRAGLQGDGAFRACLQGLVNAIPRTKHKGEWVRPEAGTLDRICSLYFPDIEIPPEPELPTTGEQGELDLDA
jgi:adenine-specific DNA methylase